MSKKKAFSGSTMTLKDFHGGSIPSDLPLPSAPGVTVRPLDRGGYERPIGGAWGSGGIASTGRSDHHRPRPGSAGGGAPRGLEEGAPFLPHIGRNFDEDERKPFDASSTPRRTAAPPVDDAVRVIRLVEAKPQVHQQVLAPGRPGSSPAMQLSAQGHHSFGGSVAAVVGGGSHPSSSHSQGLGSAGVVPNAWGVKKDVANETPAQPVAMLSVPGAASRFAQASAIEKVSSGRWQSKHVSFHQQPDIEVIRFSETASGDVKSRGNNEVVADGESERRYVERGIIDRDYDGARIPVYLEEKERGIASGFGSDRARPLSAEGRFTGQQLHQQDITEVSERLKLNGLPRTKPLERLDARALDHKQVYQPPNVVAGDGENAADVHGNANPSKLFVTGTDVGNPPVERPKLNLLPRSQHIGHASESVDRARGDRGDRLGDEARRHSGASRLPGSQRRMPPSPSQSLWALRELRALQPPRPYQIGLDREKVFGSARPREIVLKERGIDDADLSNVDQVSPATRVKHESPRVDVKPEHPSPTSRHGERIENYPLEQRVGRDPRKDQRVESEKTDTQRSSWRNDNRRNPREVEKPVERCPEPENWRKPEEHPKPHNQGLRFGKGASALELAQAFSRLTETTEIYSGAARRHINGY
ncbi:hypothetical protein Taro_012879 [Colocasia esculenta]|uniref:Uncharacterized protein n=1 Tax=Colocasia esculenta TaxID=4460 RepID=A0A843U560_COLES|nr:hypothetical protein [Colocasia esculenta]